MVVDFTEANQKVSDYSNVWTIYALVNKVQLGQRNLDGPSNINEYGLFCPERGFLTWIPKAF